MPSATSVALSAAGAQATVTVTQAAYTGPFNAQSSNAAIATVAQGAQTNSFIITAGSTAGTATVTISGAAGSAPAVITVVLTLTQGVVQ